MIPLLNIDKTITTKYNFGTAWELFKLNDHEILNHVVPEVI